MNGAGETAVELVNGKLVSLQAEVQALLLKCERLKEELEETSKSSIGQHPRANQIEVILFFAKKFMSALGDYFDSDY